MTLTPKQLKRILIGKPFPTRADIHERLDKLRALAIFASDPISSNAYATEAIMSVLILISVQAIRLTMPIALGIFSLVLLVITSYIQTILHYPDGGGAYTVAKDNLGTLPSLFAAGALLIDYVLTVSVSVSAGIRAVTSAFPTLLPYAVLMAVVAIVLLTWVNLRGVRESGTIFAVPTYAFVAGVLLMIVIGLLRFSGLFGLAPLPQAAFPEGETAAGAVSQVLFIWLILRAFAAGCTALTGIEAISNGVQAFKPPESRNAAETMVIMGVIAMSLFVGITFLATQIHLIPTEEESILSQLTRTLTGRGFLYFWVQAFTMLILVLAANTGYQDFPRLASFLAKDGFMPRWMQNRGDRLVYNAGIVVLAAVSSIIVIIFQADEIAMLPLYALGVMLSFTLSQSGMARLMGRISRLKPGEVLDTGVTHVHYEKGTGWKRLLNTAGAIVTAIVLVILIVTKFTEGAWAVVIGIPLLVLMFRSIRGHYGSVATSLSTRDFALEDLKEIADIVIVPIGDVHRGTLRAINYAKRLSSQVRAVSIVTSETMRELIHRRWDRFPTVTQSVELVLIDYEYRDILTPIVEYIEGVSTHEFPGQLITVVIPEFIPETFMGRLLHNHTAAFLQSRLRTNENIVIIDVPYQVHS